MFLSRIKRNCNILSFDNTILHYFNLFNSLFLSPNNSYFVVKIIPYFIISHEVIL